MAGPLEIVRITADHGVLYVKIPRSFIAEKKLKKGDYLIFKQDRSGNLVLSTYESEVKRGKQVGKHRRGAGG